MSGKQAHEWGLANVIMGRRDVLEQAVMLAEQVAERPPLALRYAKRAIQAADDVGLADGLERERELFADALATEDRVEGVEALLEGRRPDFSGRSVGFVSAQDRSRRPRPASSTSRGSAPTGSCPTARPGP